MKLFHTPSQFVGPMRLPPARSAPVITFFVTPPLEKILMKIAATFLAACLAFVSTANAAAIFEITEAYIGVSGPDGTEDWFELTNVGDMSGSTGGLYYDDSSADPTEDSPLSAFTLAPGESAIFLIDVAPVDETDKVNDFEAIWGTGITVGITGAAGALGGGGDAIYIFDSNLCWSEYG